MKKPSLKQMKARTTLWFDGDDLRICLPQKENRKIFSAGCPDKPACKTCRTVKANSWWYKSKEDKLVTSFFSIEGVRYNYEFLGFA